MCVSRAAKGAPAHLKLLKKPTAEKKTANHFDQTLDTAGIQLFLLI